MVLTEPVVVFKGEAIDVEVGSVLTDPVDEDTAVVVREIKL